MSNSYAVGTLVTLTGTFKDLAGTLTDPSTVECEVKTPDGEVTALSVTRVSLGVYNATFTPVLIGGHSYKFQGTGACQVAAFSSFNATGQFQ